MPKTRVKKEEEVGQLAEQMAGGKLTVLATFEGVTVKDTEALRKELREQQSGLVMAKKTILNRVLTQLKLDGPFVGEVKGTLGLASSQDEVSAAKIVKKFSKDRKQMTLAGGWLEGKPLDAAQVAALASLPSREELVAKTLYVIKAPLTGLVGVLQGNARGLVYALKAIADSKQV